MEYVDGTTSPRCSRAGRCSRRRGPSSIALQLCEMLETCHAVLRRDRRPQRSSASSTATSSPKTSASRRRARAGPRLRHRQAPRRRPGGFTHNLFGSLPYTPPERLERGGVDRQSDLWAAGRGPLPDGRGPPAVPGEDPEELEAKIRHGEPPAPLPETVSPGLKKIVSRRPGLRPPSGATRRAELCGGPRSARGRRAGSGRHCRPESEHRGRPGCHGGRDVPPAARPPAAGTETRRTDAPIADPLEATRRNAGETRRTGADPPLPRRRPRSPRRPRPLRPLAGRRWLAWAGVCCCSRFGVPPRSGSASEAREIQHALIGDEPIRTSTTLAALPQGLAR